MRSHLNKFPMLRAYRVGQGREGGRAGHGRALHIQALSKLSIGRDVPMCVLRWWLGVPILDFGLWLAVCSFPPFVTGLEVVTAVCRLRAPQLLGPRRLQRA